MSQATKSSADNPETRIDVDDTAPSTTSPLEDVEAQMRRALGLHNGIRIRPDHERAEQAGTPRLAERFNPNHRRRFVQDGEVQVSYVRRDAATDVAARQSAGPSPLAAKLQRAEAQLAAETAARQQAERGYHEAQATIRDLRTKLGHADLAHREALEAARREREHHAAQRAALQEELAQLQEGAEQVRALKRELSALQAELADERAQRKALEKALHAAEEAREAAERLVRVLSEEPAQEPANVTNLTSRRASRSAARAAAARTSEPEPVKWWLNTGTAKRR